MDPNDDPPSPADRTLPAMLERQAARGGDRPLFVAGATRWTVAETRDLAAGQAASLARLGVGAGDRVAILCGNRGEFIRLYLACAWLGAVLVPINTAVKAPQLRYVLANSGARWLAIEDTLAGVLTDLDRGGLAIEAVLVIGDAAAVSGSPGAQPFPE